MKRSVALAAGLLLALGAHADERLPELPQLGIEPGSTSVIGVSSGGYMATQLAVAWPERFHGLAVLAAGPWSCAQGGLGQALGQCMATRRGPPDLASLDLRLREYQAQELVGEADALAGLRAYVWHGEEDRVVAPALGVALAEQLSGWLASPDEQLKVVRSPDVGHGWPIQSDGQVPPSQLAQCRSGGGTHLLACDMDVAGEALTWLHGELEPPGESSSAELLRFDQTPFATRGMGKAGYVLIPESCKTGGCNLTVALHGCGMTEEHIEDTFSRYSGLNAWAEANQRVVLYPQATTSLANPQGCWDWWGFAESTWQLDPLHDTREGVQVRALIAMIEWLEQPIEE
ncbi:poly(3-hydroxybutyrate) depolymerase [Billgrantia kenyensis]|uniref:Poly(3-hydroxybutyrate) depolymerase n=1 Tax=Billgrantia kenyensis TaxID=321266 RepID=A0A7W0AEN3_9GAMM|nr:poly(3-hydroxybutyrate) depolymerase [Halomonas kenyensis]MBA2779784.1 poly(3-hydroxybutyrate) depolymerase [Halomonas kenyensis]MCG6662185.1 poly(3-hydroxybutyrate) depolymerase [Halomonas kenyensis]